jgi:3-oxoacyl-[acyl-carrier-protein] synthase II
MTDRAVITGTSALCAAGLGVDAAWAALTDPASRARPGALEAFGFEPGAWMSARDLRRTDPSACYAVAAALLALADAGDPVLEPARTAVLTSISHSASVLASEQDRQLQAEGETAVFPLFATMQVENSPAARVCQAIGARGTTRGIAGACAGGTLALVEAAELVRSGACDVAVAGGTQGRLADVVRASYRNARVFAESGWERPFDRRRDGYLDTTGAAFLVVESAEHASARGATVLAEVLGGANTNDAGDMISPSGVGARECMEQALGSAGLQPSAIGYVNAHGTGTKRNDLTEAGAVRAVFGEEAPPVTSFKWALGHLFAAAGAIEAVLSIRSMHEGVIPSAGFDLQPDPEIDLDVVSGAPRLWSAAPVLSNSFGLGGQNACVVLGPPSAT